MKFDLKWGYNFNICRRFSFVREPSRVLFFGSDEFSTHSLKGLDALRKQFNGRLIDEIQVVTRSPKWCGRYNSVLRKPPIMDAVEKLGLVPVIHCDTTEELLALNEKGQFDILVAVSFGKLIPDGLISNIPVSLNVHPSLLPLYRGASPIQYALLNKDQYTGVSVQTLHPTRFDCGRIVAQSAPLLIDALLAKGTVSTFDEPTPKKTAILMDQLGLEGSRLLQKVIKNKLYLPKNEELNETTFKPSYANKISAKQRKINWQKDTANDIVNKLETLGPVYAFKKAMVKKSELEKRVLFHNIEEFTDTCNQLTITGEFRYDELTKSLLVMCHQSTIVQIHKLQYEGFKIETAQEFMSRLPKRCGKQYAKLLNFK